MAPGGTDTAAKIEQIDCADLKYRWKIEVVCEQDFFSYQVLISTYGCLRNVWKPQHTLMNEIEVECFVYI